MPAKNNAVLIVEDSATFSSLLRRRIDKTLGLKSVVAATRAEAVEVLEKRRDDFCVTLLDLNLPDASDGEILDSVLGYGIPSIVFTGSYSDVLREKVLARNVVDYVPKESVHDLEYLLKLISRLRKNRSTKILVVDDSQTTRMFILNLLRLRNFQSLEAESGAEALDLLKLNPDIKLVITDYNMPGIDGFELTQRIRKCHSLREMEAPRTIVARFGGEEFCIIFIDDAGDASQRIETLRRRIEASPVPWLKSFSVTASLGHLRGAPQELESMLARADQLLYQAKQTGRNRVVEELS